MTVINPTIGRMVLYKPTGSDHLTADAGGYLAAIVVFVHSDSLVSLCVYGGDGVPTLRTNVALIQDGQTAPTYGGYCCWMPCQLGQAQRAEAAEKATQDK